MGIDGLKDMVRGVDREKSLSIIVNALTKKGETQRITTLNSSQLLFIFEMYTYHKIYFKKLYNNDELGTIPELMEIYMNLCVSETDIKSGNLLQILADIFKTEIIVESGENKLQDNR